MMVYQLLAVLACLAGVCVAQDMPAWEILVNGESRGNGPVFVNEGDNLEMICTTADPSNGFIVNKQQRLKFVSGKSQEDVAVAVQGTMENLYSDRADQFSYTFTYDGPIVSTFKIQSVTGELDGQFFCEVWPNRGDTFDNSVPTEVIVVSPVQKVEMNIASQNIQDDTETTINLRPAEYQVSCEVSGSNPPPTIKLMIGDQELPGEYEPTLDPDSTSEGRSYRAKVTVSLNFNYDYFGKKLSCRGDVQTGDGPLPAKETSVTLEGITDLPQVACTNSSAGVNDRKVTLSCIVSYEPKVKMIAFNFGNEKIYPGNTTDDMIEVNKQKLNSTHEQVTIKFYQVNDRHFDENIYLDVLGYDGKTHQYPVFLRKATGGDVSGATKAAVFVPLVCLIALLRLL